MGIDFDKYTKGQGADFFKAKDMSSASVLVEIKAVRELNLPNSGDTVVIDFDYKKQERALPLNKTNLKMLLAKIGPDDKRWLGVKIKLVKVLVTNPKTKKEVDGIRIK